MLKSAWRVSMLLLAAMSVIGGAEAADPPLELKWAQLRPPAQAVAPAKPKTFFSGATAPPADDSMGPPSAPPPPPLAEGEWMSVKRRQPGADLPPRVVKTLDGKRVRIGGYVVPLDFEATEVKEFLLVPFVGACVHVPPPPANQIVYVKSEKGFPLGGLFDPVTVTGTMKTEMAFTGIADAGYSIAAESVEKGAE